MSLNCAGKHGFFCFRIVSGAKSFWASNCEVRQYSFACTQVHQLRYVKRKTISINDFSHKFYEVDFFYTSITIEALIWQKCFTKERRRGMNNFLKMIDIQSVLLIYILMGVYARKRQFITKDNQQKFIDFVLNVLMPCMVFNSFKDITLENLKGALVALIVSFIICFIAIFLGKIVYRDFPEDKQAVMRYATLVNNAGFAGLPLANDTFGAQGLMYASVFIVPNRIFMWSAGISMLSHMEADRKTIIRNVLKNPNIIAVELGILRGLLQIHFPVFIETTLSRVGACVAPLSMMVVGAIIADVSLKTVMEKGILRVALVRMIILPIITLMIFKALGMNEAVSGSSMILSAMPAGATTGLLAAKYGANVEYASKLILVTTILSLVTAPLLMLLL